MWPAQPEPITTTLRIESFIGYEFRLLAADLGSGAWFSAEIAGRTGHLLFGTTLLSVGFWVGLDFPGLKATTFANSSGTVRRAPSSSR